MVVTASAEQDIPFSFSDLCKRVFLGKPLITEELSSERLSISVALGALSPDAISSTAYGPEQILTELLPQAGLAAFVLLLPIMGVILVILALVAAAAVLIDYIVPVAVQSAAGTVAVASALR